MNKFNKKGFTLIEILSVIIILSLIITIVATKGFGAFDNTKEKIKEINKENLNEIAKIIKIDIENCDDSDTELHDMFGVTSCNELSEKLSSNTNITLEDLIKYKYIDKSSSIEEIKNEEHYTITYKKEEDNILYEIIETIKKPILASRKSFSSTENYYQYKDKIVEVKFVKYIDIEGKTYWNVKDTSSNTDVYAWLENTDDSNYILYIGATTKIYALSLTNFFYGFKNLKNIDFGNLDTSEVNSMAGMFSYCTSLEMLNLSTFNTKQVLQMSEMFSGCNSLKELDLSNFDTTQVQDMSYMFSECKSLSKLNINFNTKSLKKMNLMFRYCYNLTYLDLSSFILNSTIDVSNAFYKTTNLKNICINEDNAAKLYNEAINENINVLCN